MIVVIAGIVVWSTVNGVGVEEKSGEAPMVFFVTQGSPNPFRYKIEFMYGVPDTGKVEIIVYDIAGREVAGLGHGEKKPGCYTMCWSGKNEWGQRLKSGIYFCRVKISDFIAVRKFIFLAPQSY